jgi:hypothetical protein
MGTLIAGVVALLIIVWFVNKYVQANPQGMAYLIQKGGGVAALVAAVFLLSIGQLAVALPLALMGAGLLGWVSLDRFGFPSGRSTGQMSRVRSSFLEMELDHDTGAMRGRFVAGRHQGASLETFETSALVGLLGDLDEESRALLMAYLDRRDARWREHAQGGATAGQGGAARSGKMTQEEAYQILGLQPGASTEDIGRAHRALMKKLHPDQGGSTYLAARVNEAKDVLLRRHT